MKTSMMPREHMQSAPSMDALSDVELLAVVLGKGVRGCGVVEFATRLYAALEDVWSNPEAAIDWRSMAEYVRRYNERNPSAPIIGLGEVRILEIAAAFALARRLQGRWKMSELRQLSMRSTPAAFTVFRNVMARHPEQENFFVLPIDSDFRPICEPIAVTRGGVASVSVHPRIAETLAAFMNADGGMLYVGIADDKQIRGIEGDLRILATDPSSVVVRSPRGNDETFTYGDHDLPNTVKDNGEEKMIKIRSIEADFNRFMFEEA